MLRITNLNAGYEDHPVLRNTNLALNKGTIGVLMGPNGAGKSTLLKTIFNLVAVTTGSITWNEQELTGLPAHSLLAEGIAYVPQGKVNFGMLTVEENLALGTHMTSKDQAKKAINTIFEQFPMLQNKRRERAYQLSGGQQQTLALARALIHTPQLLLLDEPSLGLAPKLVKQAFATIQHINKNFHTTILVVEHNIKSVLDIAHTGYIMVNGQTITHGPIPELKRSDVLQKVFVGEYE